VATKLGLQEVDIRSRPADRDPPGRPGVVAALGFLADLGPIESWGLDLDHQPRVRVDSPLRTARERIYAAGDVADLRRKVKTDRQDRLRRSGDAVNNLAVALNPGSPHTCSKATPRKDGLTASA